MVNPPRRFDVVLVELDPAVGHEMQKTRPCLVISPDALNFNVQTCIVAPLTTGNRAGPSRFPCVVDGKAGFVVLDQVRAVDRARVLHVLGQFDEAAGRRVLKLLRTLFED